MLLENKMVFKRDVLAKAVLACSACIKDFWASNFSGRK
jgi:hypothetical protein